MTEWELSKESEDFARAASLYRPLSVTMASRFTSAKYADSEKDVKLPDMSEVRLVLKSYILLKEISSSIWYSFAI